ncbi:MAG: hypothetical protein C4530_17935, partial [Desulfobacteraceae bacterium]
MLGHLSPHCAVITEVEYQRLTRACDELIGRPDAPQEIAAVPWLHIINEVPFILSAYSDVLQETVRITARMHQSNPFVSVRNLSQHPAYHFAQFMKGFVRSFYYRDSRRIGHPGLGAPALPDLGLAKADVVIVTWLVNRNHLDGTHDFYFGEIQERLKKRGLSTLLLMRNQSGFHSPELQRKALRKGSCARFLLPDTQSPRAEVDYLIQMLRLRIYLRTLAAKEPVPYRRRLYLKVSELSVLTPGLQNLRLHQQVQTVCRKLSPSVVMTLYEGHAWERFVWHGAREANPQTLCIGYQHTILRKNSHAMKRGLHPGRKGYDPDVLFALGEITHRMLENS